MLLAAKRGASSFPLFPLQNDHFFPPRNPLLINHPNIKNIRELMKSWFGYRLPPYFGYVAENIRELMTSWFGYRLPPYFGYVAESFHIAT
jgi:hypothetical protein